MPSLRIPRLLVTNVIGSSGVSVYTISGTVYDADGSTAVAGATVALGALSAVSAANGTYTIADVPAGASGSMTCTKAGYSWTAITVAAMTGNLTSQNYSNAWWAVTGIAAGCLRAYRGIGMANVAASQVNLANPGTNDLVVPSGQTQPTFNAATGWSATQAAPKYWDTGLVLDPNNHSWIARVSGAADVDECRVFGVILNNFSQSISFDSRFNSTNVQYNMNSGQSVVGNLASGTAGQGLSNYLDGVNKGAASRGITTFSESCWLMGSHREGTSTAHRSFQGNLLAIAFYSTKLSDATMVALHNAISALTNP